MSSKDTLQNQLEHLQMKYVGTGHADLSKYEWITNQKRDTYASFIGHFSMVSYISIVENESNARVKHNLLNKMILPCGPKPETEDDVDDDDDDEEEEEEEENEEMQS
eukprot:TRINITY_DN422_c3_g1_i1.p1 TRINITY_DN422_c3_g1~~TRINITY_DN422_c3_g1_i1.p1  ORF type:complete len:120 (+),score=50.40 TRINITY_DN422_c3_g1_i1:40-360(+)